MDFNVLSKHRVILGRTETERNKLTHRQIDRQRDRQNERKRERERTGGRGKVRKSRIERGRRTGREREREGGRSIVPVEPSCCDERPRDGGGSATVRPPDPHLPVKAGQKKVAKATSCMATAWPVNRNPISKI